MFTQSKKILTIVLTVAMLMTVGAGATYAQESTLTPGDGPGTALQPTADTVTIAPNSWQWYIFRSQVPINVDASGNDVVTDPRDATIDAALYTQASGLDFEVWSSDNLNNWLNNSDFDAIGNGTENDFINGDPLFWKGSFKTNDNYYLIVRNSGSAAASYMLDISGNVRFPSDLTLGGMVTGMAAEAMAPAMIEQPVMSSGEMALTVDLPAEVATSTSDMAMNNLGYGPESALMPASGNVTIAPNAWQWYSFQSQLPINVDADGNDLVTNPADATIEAALRVQSGAADFEVWSKNDLNNWYNNADFDPLGMGTENEYISGDPLFWKGSFTGNDTYYLIVKNTSAQPATYSLDIYGNVSFPTAAMLAVQ